MKKRIVIAFVAGLLCLSSCDQSSNSHPDQGKKIDNKKALEVLRSINEAQQKYDSEEMTKFTYSMTEIFDDTTIMETYSRFSKEDHYFYHASKITNLPVYEGYEDEYKVYHGTIHTSYDLLYRYINDGKLYDVRNEYYDATMRNEDTGDIERKTESDSYYRIYSEEQSESEKLFHNNILTQLNDLIYQLASHSNQMLRQFEPVLENNTTNHGVEIEIRSKGEGCLYLRESMPSQGLECEAIYENYWLSKSKISFDYTKMGITALGYKKATTEISYQFGVCDVTYPDLNYYEKKE